MKVNIIKPHHEYPFGEVDVDEDRARYLIGVGVAEGIRYDIVTFVDEVKEIYPAEVGERAIAYFEKENKLHAKEKKENKTGNVPTAKKKKQ